MPTKKKEIDGDFGSRPSKFFCYNQNNSGGGFDFDEKRGISCYVIIEAATAQEADDRAETIGLYFDGCDAGRDCECCGDRWYTAYGEGEDSPRVYGADVDFVDHSGRSRWMKDAEPEGYIHYLDHTITPFWEKRRNNDEC